MLSNIFSQIISTNFIGKKTPFNLNLKNKSFIPCFYLALLFLFLFFISYLALLYYQRKDNKNIDKKKKKPPTRQNASDSFTNSSNQTVRVLQLQNPRRYLFLPPCFSLKTHPYSHSFLIQQKNKVVPLLKNLTSHTLYYCTPLFQDSFVVFLQPHHLAPPTSSKPTKPLAPPSP